MAQYSSEEIDEVLKANPPVYSSGIYFTAMAKKLGISEQIVKNKCAKLGLINIKIRKSR
jgi:DNA-binding transcriptional regulator LsrR (DeoR family)